jgi:hypothetical protein
VRKSRRNKKKENTTSSGFDVFGPAASSFPFVSPSFLLRIFKEAKRREAKKEVKEVREGLRLNKKRRG